MKPPKRIREISDKRAAKLAAKGVKLYGRSVAPSSKPKKSRNAKTVGRGAMPQRRSKPNARNSKRAKANHARAFGTAEQIARINNEPCVNCGRWPSQNAHIKNGGMSRRADAKWKLPLCTIDRDGKTGCHETFDQGKRSFRAAYLAAKGETMEQTAERRWLERTETDAALGITNPL